jgi:xanthine/CO dehydrogenase XdhC/CoxF family maturation factor
MSLSAVTESPKVRLDTSLELIHHHVAMSVDSPVMATIVRTAGSTYRKAGARMMLFANGDYVGLLSGGCLEADLREHADSVRQTGIARAIEYDLRGPDDILYGIGAGCEGAMRVLLEPAGPGSRVAHALEEAIRVTAAGKPSALVLVHDASDVPLGTYGLGPPLTSSMIQRGENALASGRSEHLDTANESIRERAFIEYLAPTPQLLICGAGPDAQPVASAARALGWRVVIVDHRPAYAVPERFEGADVRLAPASALADTVRLETCHAVVVMSHHLPSDEIYLRILAQSHVPAYVGLLGPSARRRRLLEALGPIGTALTPRLRAPVGLAIGAVTPEGIALSMISEIHAFLAGL